MFTIIGGDGKEYGPVTAEQVKSWIASGRANLTTKAKAAGSAEWRALGDFAEFNGTGAGTPPLTAPPPAPAGDVDAKTFADDLIARGTPLDISECLGRSISLWTSNFLPLVGVTLLVILAECVANMIPILGLFSGLLLKGVFYGGLYYYYLGKLRGEHREVGDAFAGFKRAFVPLMVATLLTSIIVLGLGLAFCAPLFLFFIKTALQGGLNHVHELPEFSGLAIVSMLFGFLVMLFLSVSWSFTFPLVMDRGLSPWTAMEVSRRLVARQWFRVFGVVLVGAILAVLGLLGLIIGVFFTLPLVFCAVACAYEAICNPPPRA